MPLISAGGFFIAPAAMRPAPASHLCKSVESVDRNRRAVAPKPRTTLRELLLRRRWEEQCNISSRDHLRLIDQSRRRGRAADDFLRKNTGPLNSRMPVSLLDLLNFSPSVPVTSG
jgi:hypothetical protein